VVLVLKLVEMGGGEKGLRGEDGPKRGTLSFSTYTDCKTKVF
jgi:hypothetical protein